MPGLVRRPLSLALVGLLMALAVEALPAAASQAITVTPVDWPTYLYSASHSSSSPAKAITLANSTTLIRRWHFRSPGRTVVGQPGAGFSASPSVYHGVVYLGSNTGVLYALGETTGQVLWSRMLGYVTAHTCGARGITATPAIAIDPVTSLPTVYEAGGDGNLYALDAATGNIVWTAVVATPSSTQNDYYNWSSPTVANGRVYVGVSSQCDAPLVDDSGVKAFDQSTGTLLGTYFSMPNNVIGGSVWTSVAVGPSGDLFVTTGNAAPGQIGEGDSASIVRVDGTTMASTNKWAIPNNQLVQDNDFDASPTMFVGNLNGTPTDMVGACNKNGNFYAFRADDLSAGPVWSRRVGVGTAEGVISCLAAAIWDGTHLFIGGNATTIGGSAFNGSMRMLDPATGAVLWEVGLPGNVLGSPALNGSGVLAAATYANGIQNGTFLMNAVDGSTLRFIQNSKEFSQPVFADKFLFLANIGGTLNVYRPPA